MIEVFKSTVNNKVESQRILKVLATEFPDAKINFDLEDCDNILRIEASDINIQSIQEILLQYGHTVELLN